MTRLVINEHCLNLARQVDIESELKIEKSGDKTKIEKINERRKILLKAFKEYEAKCVKDMEATRGILIESINKSKQWAQKIRESLENNNELEQQSASEHLRHLKTLRHELKGFQFGGRIMLFNEGNVNFDHSFGRFKIKRLRVPRLLESYFMQKKPIKFTSSNLNNKK
jgi:hypothetical protein